MKFRSIHASPGQLTNMRWFPEPLLGWYYNCVRPEYIPSKNIPSIEGTNSVLDHLFPFILKKTRLAEWSIKIFIDIFLFSQLWVSSWQQSGLQFKCIHYGCRFARGCLCCHVVKLFPSLPTRISEVSLLYARQSSMFDCACLLIEKDNTCNIMVRDILQVKKKWKLCICCS